MRSTMLDVPLSIATIVRHGTSIHGRSEVLTTVGEESRRASYQEVGRRAARLAHALHDELGISGDERVATFQWNNQEHLEAYLAVPAMGAVVHPLNIRLPGDQLIHVARHADDRVAIVDPSLAPALARLLPRMPTLAHVVLTGERSSDAFAEARAALAEAGKPVHGYEELIAPFPDEYGWPEVEERAAAAMCYTSGTTGDPKGVVYSHRSIYLHSMQLCMQEGLGLSSRERLLVVVPMFHVMAWGLPYASMLTGATLVLPDRHVQAPPLAATIARDRPTKAAGVPTVWRNLLAHLDEHGGDVSSLREVKTGGAACPPALMRAYEERYGITVVHAWGMTETSPLAAVSRPPAYATGEDAWAYRVTQGRVPAGVRARLVGPDGNVLPNDGAAVGELEVSGPWITGSYYRGDEDGSVADRFDDGWLRTGDVGTLTADGFLTLTDRVKDVIKSGGEWISSVELENQLMAHPGVAEASVVGVPDERWGERPLAAVVLRAGKDTTLEELRDFLAEHLARWQVPERWAVIDEVPKTSVGKFDKKLLRARYRDGAFDVVELGRG